MKLAILIGLLFSSLLIFAQENVQSVSNADIVFEKETHDFGKLQKGDPGTCTFVFKNTGTEPLILSNVKASCGCTTPSWPKEPIAPGKKGEIKVKYDTNRIGVINKSVTITSNAKTATKVLRILGEVEPEPQIIAPIKEDNMFAPKTGN